MEGATDSVELVVIGDDARFGGGHVVGTTDDGLDILVAADLGIGAGDKVCVRHDEADSWLHGLVTGAEGRRISLRVDRTTRRDHREFPRMFGAIDVRYAGVDPDAAVVETWLSSGEAGAVHWCRPDPLMNFSASGVQFDTAHPIDPSRRLLLSLATPGDDTTYRAVARIVRVDPIPEDELEDEPFEEGEAVSTHRMAVHFTEVPSEAISALMAFTERLQRTYLDKKP